MYTYMFMHACTQYNVQLLVLLSVWGEDERTNVTDADHIA